MQLQDSKLLRDKAYIDGAWVAGGKTFAVTGMDLSGQKQQYVFHLGQFQDEAAYKNAKSYLEVYR